MKIRITFILLLSGCFIAHAQFPMGMQEKNPERFKAPDYKPYEDSLLHMNHFMTEIWEPEVAKVNPGAPFSNAPADAIVLFDGKDVDKEWVEKTMSRTGGMGEQKMTCEIRDGAMYPPKGWGMPATKRNFEDFQLHIEWMILPGVTGSSQARGNGGVYLQGLYEIQILDSWGTRTYKNGQSGSLYKQYAPLVNVNLPPGEWQAFDIIYTAPRFSKDSTVYFTPPRVTILQNGVVIQNNVELRGPTTYVGIPETMIKKHGPGPIMLQNRNSLAFRNIWIREL